MRKPVTELPKFFTSVIKNDHSVNGNTFILHLMHHILDYSQDNQWLPLSESVKTQIVSASDGKLKMNAKEPVWDKSHTPFNSSFSILQTWPQQCLVKLLCKNQYENSNIKLLDKTRFFSQMLSLKLNFDKFTAWLHLPQGGRKTGAMQLRFFLYDLSLMYTYTKCRNVTIMTTQKIFLKVTCHTV